MDNAEYFPVSSFSSFFYYHPYGNTPPENLLQSVTGPIPNPQLLLLGCGDLRSCLFTLWSNFYHKNSRHFKGVHFVLNDSSAAVLARNIIFLYLCTQMPTDHSDRVKWVASFWSIWYSHELLPHHKEVLINALSQLLKWSESIETWSKNTDNPLRSLVQFADSTTLSKVHQAWKMWYNDTSTTEEIRKSRAESLKSYDDNFKLFQNPVRQLFNYFGGILFKNLSHKERKSMMNDLNSYYKDGVAFAEEVFGLPVINPRLANNTFIVRSDQVYNLPCNFTPYRCFFFAFQFSPENLKHLRYSNFPLMVKDDKFTHHPLLANSVQLFSIWVRSCAEIMSQCQYDILFTFQCSDALEFCQQLHNKPYAHLPEQFDAIYASNLLDYISPLSLVLLAMPILKSTGSLFTTVNSYMSDSNTSTEYLEKQFGFQCKHLQLLCGVQCIGYENEYSSTISVKPIPYSYNVDIALGVHTKSFVWRHVTAIPLRLVTEKHFAKMWNTLNNSIVNLLACYHDRKNWNCTGTVIILLQSFASRFDKEYNCCSYQFWLPLCSLLLKQKSLHLFLASLQTQALLHGVHLHLLVSQSECPLCNNQPVSQSIKQVSFTVHTKLVTFFAPDGGEAKFSILVYSSSLVGVVDNHFWLSQHPECFSGNLHIMDTIYGKITAEELKVSFFSLVDFIQKGYYLSLVSTNKEVIVCKELSSCEVIDGNFYSFCKLINPCFNEHGTKFSLGVILQHSGDENSFETIISLSDETMVTIKNHQLTTIRLSDSTIRIKANKYFVDVSYPYSVQYDTVTIRLSRSQRRITVIVNRTCHCVFDEDPVFVVNPENVLCLPTMPISKTDAMSFFNGQSLPKVSSYGHFDPGQDEVDLKESVYHLFLRPETHFCCVNESDPKMHQIKCLILILNRVFDLQNKVPALDILYCHSTEIMSKSKPTIHLGFMPRDFSYPIKVCVNQAQTQLCNKMLDYFAKCTVATSMPVRNELYKGLVEFNVQHHFSRAVIYPLYPNLDKGTADPIMCGVIFNYLFTDSPLLDMQMQLPYWLRFLKTACFEEDKCSYCKCYKENLRKCSKCQLVQYCNRDCQKKHWQAHKPHCIDPR